MKFIQKCKPQGQYNHLFFHYTLFSFQASHLSAHHWTYWPDVHVLSLISTFWKLRFTSKTMHFLTLAAFLEGRRLSCHWRLGFVQTAVDFSSKGGRSHAVFHAGKINRHWRSSQLGSTWKKESPQTPPNPTVASITPLPPHPHPYVRIFCSLFRRCCKLYLVG